MGKIICKKHGGNAIVETCSHIAGSVDSGKPFLGHRLNGLPALYVCNQCFEHFGLAAFSDLPPFSLTESDEVLNRRSELTDVQIEGKRIFCSKCVTELHQAETKAVMVGDKVQWVRLPPRENEAYPCPCCKFKTLRERGGDEICPVCFWEDDGQDEADAERVLGGPNGNLSLRQAQENFRQFAACDERFRANVRPALPDEK